MSTTILSKTGARLIGVFILCSFALTVLASSMYDVGLRGERDLYELQISGLDLTHVDPLGMVARVIIHDEIDLETLSQTGLRYVLRQADIQQYYANRLAPARDDMGGYFTLDEIVEQINMLFEDFDHIVSEPISIGQSIEERDIWAVKISDNPEEDEDEPEVLIFSLVHAREVITPHIVIEGMQTLIDGYQEDEYISNLVDNREIWFIPCVNPDGYAENERTNPDGGGMHRKNMRDNGEEGVRRGVDLNRNFGFAWGYDDIGSDPRPREQTYRGESAFSEPESQVIRDFVNERNFVNILNYHSYGNLCLVPPGYDYIHVEDRPLFMALGEKLVSENIYLLGTGWEAIYVTNGDTDDWFYSDTEDHEKAYAFTIEVGTRNDGFWPDLERKPVLIEENILPMILTIDYADNPARGFPPPQVTNMTHTSLDDGETMLNWDAQDNEDNPAEYYNITGRIPGDDYVYAVEPDDELWDPLFVTETGFQPHSAPRCYRFEVRSSISFLTFTKEIIAPDRLNAWIRINLSTNNNFALEVTEDGFEWFAAPGRNTQELDVEGYNHGHVLRRIETDNWEQYWWDLSDWEGRQIKFRFRYYRFSFASRNDFLYIDDIGPLPGVEWEEVIAENVEGTQWIDEEDREDEGFEYLVQAVDAEGDVSFMSLPAVEGEDREGLFLPIDAGWSMISIPYELDEPGMRAVFRALVEDGLFVIIKDDIGRFYSDEWDYNSLPDWDPLQGYQIKLSGDAELEYFGERIPVNSEINLREGWGMISYLPEIEMPAEEALASVEDNLILAKDDHGRFWVVEHDYSNLNDLAPGEGYYLKVAEEDVLIYPEGNQDGQGYSPQRGENVAIQFKPLSSLNHSILLRLPESLFDGQIIFHDKNNEVAGRSGKISERQVGMAVWGREDKNSPGCETGDEFNINYQIGTDLARQVDYKILAGDNSWQENGFSELEISAIDESQVEEFEMFTAYPNPFNGITTFSYQLLDRKSISLEIYNISGRLIQRLIPGKGNSVRGELIWDAMNLPSGIYYAKLAIDGKNSGLGALKLLLLR